MTRICYVICYSHKSCLKYFNVATLYQSNINHATRLLELAIRGIIADNIPSALVHDVFHKSAFVASRAVMKKIIRRSPLGESAYARVCRPRPRRVPDAALH